MDKRLDLLNREEFVENVIKIVNQLSDIKRGCCFAIEGGWGVGKTFVIEKIEDRLKVFLSEETNSDRYFVFHYNCWQHDYYEEPAVAIISAMLASIREDEVLVNGEAERIIKAGYEFVGEELKKIAGLYIENKIGINLISWAEDIKNNKEINQKAENEFDEMFNFSQTIEKVRKKLQEIAEERTIVLFVDELDRCIPQYAIKVLERLHHIFYGLDNVVVIMAIDRKQLEHSVEEMFGVRKDESSIDIEKYLKKFIDFSVVLDNGVLNEFYWRKYKTYIDKFQVSGGNDAEKACCILSIFLDGIDIRNQEKIIEKAHLIHCIVCNELLDISVWVFEMIYAILKFLKVPNMGAVFPVNNGIYVGMERDLGQKKADLVRKIKTENIRVGSDRETKFILPNLYGLIFWYFINIFHSNEVNAYKDEYSLYENRKKELEVVKKYCEFCEMVK